MGKWGVMRLCVNIIQSASPFTPDRSLLHSCTAAAGDCLIYILITVQGRNELMWQCENVRMWKWVVMRLSVDIIPSSSPFTPDRSLLHSYTAAAGDCLIYILITVQRRNEEMWKCGNGEMGGHATQRKYHTELLTINPWPLTASLIQCCRRRLLIC